MTRGLTFSDAFWDTDIVGTYGWETLCKRMKDGKKICSEVSHYLKDRAKAEVDYSKALQNLARKADGREETGVLGDSWRNLKAQTVKIAAVHDEAATQFSTFFDEINKFNEEQSRLKKQTEDNVKKYIQSKKNEYHKAIHLKKTYEDKCKEFNNSEENVKTLKGSVTTKTSDLLKAETKLGKCKDSRENADTAYRSAIENLDSTRCRWEKETELGCNQFEDLEFKRIESLRDLLWRITNVDSMACLRHEDCSETVRKTLENCDISTDLQNFIESNTSGSKRPDSVPYENYYNGKALPPHRPTQPSAGPSRPMMPISPTRPPPRQNFRTTDKLNLTMSTNNSGNYDCQTESELRL